MGSMSDFDLNAFLASQQSEGVSKGVGNFTISHEKASQKMSQYSLPREHAWVLKLVQAAVAWKCSKLTLKQSRTASTFHFELDDCSRLGSNQDLVSALLRADLESQEPIDSLAMALRVLVERAHLSFLLLIDRGTGTSQAIYAGVFFAEMGEKKRARERESWSRGVTLRIHHIPHTDTNRLLLNYIPIRHHGLPMLTELEQYAYVCPVPLYADGRRLDGVLRSSCMNWNFHRKPLRLAGLEIPGDQEPELPICDDFTNRILTVHDSTENLKNTSSISKYSDAYFVIGIGVPKHPLGSQRLVSRSKLVWVRKGVIVEEQFLPCLTKNLTLALFVSAEGLSTDLTGFHLLQNEVLEGRQKRVINRVIRALELEEIAARDFLENPEPEPAESEPKAESTNPLIAVSSKVFNRIYETVEKSWNPTVDWEKTGVGRRYPMELKKVIEDLKKYLERRELEPQDESLGPRPWVFKT